jgi:hypothetical protein
LDWDAPDSIIANELYDHTNDTGIGTDSFESFENVNVASLPESRTQVTAMSALLRAQFKASVPVPC